MKNTEISQYSLTAIFHQVFCTRKGVMVDEQKPNFGMFSVIPQFKSKKESL